MPSSVQTLSDLSKVGYKPLSEEKSKHYAAIGRFMMVVSNEIDAKLNGLLQVMLSADEISSRAVVGEMRIPDVISAIRRIATARGLSKEAIAHMESVFAEIVPLRQARDVIAHKAIWVMGNKMAFHNAFLAKTESAIEVLYYTVNELNEFSRYAKRLGYRVQALTPILVNLPRTSVQNAYLTMLSHHIITLGAIAKLKQTKEPSKERVEALREANDKAHAAASALSALAQQVDPKLHEAQRAASEAIINYATVLTQLDAPEPASLLEIPARLRPKDRPQKNAQSRRRLPPS